MLHVFYKYLAYSSWNRQRINTSYSLHHSPNPLRSCLVFPLSSIVSPTPLVLILSSGFVPDSEHCHFLFLSLSCDRQGSASDLRLSPNSLIRSPNFLTPWYLEPWISIPILITSITPIAPRHVIPVTLVNPPTSIVYPPHLLSSLCLTTI